MSVDAGTLYALLPAVYRVRDAAVAETLDGLLDSDDLVRLAELRRVLADPSRTVDEDQARELASLEERRLRGPLKAILTVIAEQASALTENLDQLYDDQFIETCADWVVPYIGDLIGYRPLDARLQTRLGTPRADVANTIRDRRRKGTAAMLEQLAVDVTGLDAAVVEFFQRLAATQYLNHVRPAPSGPTTASIRDGDPLERLGGPFDPFAHTASVRRIARKRGRYGIANVGIFLWRVRSHPLTDSPAYRVDDRRFLFSPLGNDTALYTNVDRDEDITHLAGPSQAPLPITRRALRSRQAAFLGPVGRGGEPSASVAFLVGGQPVDPGDIESCDLSTIPGGGAETWAHMGQAKIAVDPVLGRIVFPTPQAAPVTVRFHYGFAADLGGGEYARLASFSASRAAPRRVPEDDPTVELALANAGEAEAVEVGGSGAFGGPARIVAPGGRRLELRAADTSRPLLRLAGDLVIGGGDSSELTINGFVVAGARIVVPDQIDGRPNGLQLLRLVHCTLVPGLDVGRDGSPLATTEPSLVVGARGVRLEIDRCIVGALRVADGVQVDIRDSIVDALDETFPAYAAPTPIPGVTDPGGALSVSSTTIVGTVHAQSITASNAIFLARSVDGVAQPVVAARRQEGYVRYSYLPLESRAPRRFACQPATAADRRAVVPRFVARRYGDPGYYLLDPTGPTAVASGADDGSEMGAYHALFQPQREGALLARLDEYLRFGLEAGVLYAS